MGWFPVFENFLESDEFKCLTPTEKLFFLHLVSEFNLKGQFYQSDLEISKTLATSEKTIRRGRHKLIAMGLIDARAGTRTRRNQLLATRYLWVKYSSTDEHGGFYAQMPRFTFQVMLDCLRKSRLQVGDVVVYVCLSYWYWRNRGKYEDRDRFFITKKELQSLTNLRDAPTRVPRIYEAEVFSDGDHLFEFQEEYHRLIFKDWGTYADPDDNDTARRLAKNYLKEIKEAVASEKRRREIELQKKKAMIPQTSEDHVPPISLIFVFEQRYMNKYGRRANSGATERLRELEQTFGRGAVFDAIEYYFTADNVPNGSGAKTRTLGNFVAHIDEILKLSGKSTIV
jgi:hypothetical protein